MNQSWTKKDLERATQPTRDAMNQSGETTKCALLAYARYQNKSDEPAIDHAEAKRQLDAIIDTMDETDIWNSRESQPIGILRDLTLYKQQRDRERQEAERSEDDDRDL